MRSRAIGGFFDCVGAMGMQWFRLSLLLGDFSVALVSIDDVSGEAGYQSR
jgi:hypothetical protein